MRTRIKIVLATANIINGSTALAATSKEPSLILFICAIVFFVLALVSAGSAGADIEEIAHKAFFDNGDDDYGDDDND